ncbi:hypothetical protein BDV28DRAFT_113679 [Aspergillus coremiiformis]|uniref:Uncharacterized protein n=1 Tax=Aspergillus coremiiformis TaxID=138285 RepID=A0A5N6ZAM6_9EURO|nr:hypothetical protein BDV28DRAFT_113679 [Aspergillus coremiiformis]
MRRSVTRYCRCITYLYLFQSILGRLNWELPGNLDCMALGWEIQLGNHPVFNLARASRKCTRKCIIPALKN